MDGHIDWLSFTLDAPREPSSGSDLYLLSKALIRKVSIEHESYIFNGTGVEQAASRTPYAIGLAREDAGVRIMGRSPTKTVLFELAGRACEGFRNHASAQSFIAPLVSRLSRLDYAIDILTGTRPPDFANVRNHKSFRSLSYITSDTGETVYVGSPKSDRYCRIYRYSEPHPRAKLLRVEFVFRRGLARIAARTLCETQSQERFVGQLGNTFGFAHKDWQPKEKTDEKIATPIMTRNDADTVMWLYKQVLPAARRVYASGAFDLTDWLEALYSSGKGISGDEPAER